VADRIHLVVEAGPLVTAALAAHRDAVAGETLALTVNDGTIERSAAVTAIEGEQVRISLRRGGRTSPAGA
jgi:hypothetical protein